MSSGGFGLLLAIATFLTGGLSAVIAALQLFRPEMHVRFYDFLNPGMRWYTRADWRRNIHRKESRSMGLLFLAVGLFIMYLAINRLL